MLMAVITAGRGRQRVPPPGWASLAPPSKLRLQHPPRLPNPPQQTRRDNADRSPRERVYGVLVAQLNLGWPADRLARGEELGLGGVALCATASKG